MICSIILLAYNQKRYITQSIEGILNQKVNFDYEILVNDDSSTDGTQEILKKYNTYKKLNLFLRKKNIGTTKSAYDMWRRAKGKYITFLEGDDYWTDEYYLQKAINFLEINDYIGISYRRNILKNNTIMMKAPITFCGKKGSLDLKHFLSGQMFDLTAMVFRNISFEIKDLDILYKADKFIGDITSAILLLEHGNIYVTSDTIGVYRNIQNKNGQNYNSIKNPLEMYLSHMNIISYLVKHGHYHSYTSLKLRYSKELLNISFGRQYFNEAIHIILKHSGPYILMLALYQLYVHKDKCYNSKKMLKSKEQKLL